MRGASALQKLLEEFPRASVRVLIVWEPVVLTDLGPPSSRTLARAPDARVVQFWDPGRRVSAGLLSAFAANPEKAPSELASMKPRVLWDCVALYAPGTTWKEGLVDWRAAGFPVVDSVDSLRAHLTNLK